MASLAVEREVHGEEGMEEDEAEVESWCTWSTLLLFVVHIYAI